MADIDITHNHSLGKDTAKQKASEVLARVKSKTGLDGTWSGDVFNISKPVTGTFTVTDTAVRVQINLSFLMRAMKGTIEDQIKGELRTALG
jgi:putative polyhydroxyalkanoate system protein